MYTHKQRYMQITLHTHTHLSIADTSMFVGHPSSIQVVVLSSVSLPFFFLLAWFNGLFTLIFNHLFSENKEFFLPPPPFTLSLVFLVTLHAIHYIIYLISFFFFFIL